MLRDAQGAIRRTRRDVFVLEDIGNAIVEDAREVDWVEATWARHRNLFGPMALGNTRYVDSGGSFNLQLHRLICIGFALCCGAGTQDANLQSPIEMVLDRVRINIPFAF